MAADRTDLISEYIDLPAIQKQTDAFLSQIRSVLDSLQKVNSIKITLNKAQGLFDIAKSAKDLQGNLDAVITSTNNLNASQAKQATQSKNQAQQIDDTTKSIKKQTDAIKENADAANSVSVIKPIVNSPAAIESNGISVQQPLPNVQSLKELNTEYKLLQQNTKNAILNFGEESDEVKVAADAENILKQKIDALNQSYKNLLEQKQAVNDIPFTTNINEQNQVIQPAQGKTSGSVVSDEEIANTQTQLQAQKELNTEKEKSVSITSDEQTINEQDAATTKLLSDAKDKLAFALSEANVQLKGYSLQTEQANITAKVEAEQALGLSGAYKRLTIDLASAKVEAKNLAAEFGVESIEAKKAVTTANLLDQQVKAIDKSVGESQRNVGNYSSAFTKGFSSIFSYVRQIAYILPGIGIAGILGAASDAIVSLISSLSTVKEKFDETGAHIHGYNEVVEESQKSAAKEVTQLQVLAKEATNTALPMQARLQAVKELQKEYPNYLGNLSQEAILNGQAAKQIDEAAHALYRKAFAEAASNKAADLGVKNLDLKGRENFLLNEQLKVQKEVNEAKSFGQSLSAAEIGGDTNAKLTEAQNHLDKINDLLISNREQQAFNTKEIDYYTTEAAKAAASITKLTSANSHSSDATFQILKESLQYQINALQDFVNNGSILFKERYQTAKNEAALEKELSALILQEDIKNGKNRILAEQQNSERIEDINKKLVTNLQKINQSRNANPFPDLPIATPKQFYEQQLKDLDNAHQQGLISESDYVQKFNEIQNKLFEQLPYDQQVQQQLAKKKEVNDQLLKLTSNAAEDEKNIIDKQYADEQTILNNKYADGLISKEQYEKGLRDLSVKYGKESLEASIRIAESQAKLLEPYSEAYDKLAAAIAKAKKELSDFNVKTHDSKLEDLQKQLQNVADVVNNITQAFTDIGNISFDRQKAQLQSLSDQQNAAYEQEVTQINNSMLTQDEKYKRLQILDTKHAAQQQANADKQRQIDNQKAAFDKQAALLNIIVNTAAAVVKALPNIPLAVSVGVLGLAELAAAAAAPVPTYRFGTKDHPGGFAIVGDAGKQEVIQTPDNNIFLSPAKSTLIDLPKHSKVFPDPDKFLKSGISLSHPKMKTFTVGANSDKRLESMIVEMKKEMRMTRETIKNKKEYHFEVTAFGLRTMITDALNEIEYINQNVRL